MKKSISERVLCSNLLAEVTASYKTKVKLIDQPKVSGSYQSAEYLKSIWNQQTIEYTESFVCLFLNNDARIISWAQISSGGTTSVLADPRVIFSLALSVGASAIILSHNHPSGKLTPSQADIALTNKMVELGKMLTIPIFDHIIITQYGYYSFADEGIM